MSVLIYEKKDHIGKIIINRPEVRNAINSEMVRKLKVTLDEVSKDDDVRVVVISAAGNKAFSSGFDLKESIEDPIVNVPDRRADTRMELDTWMMIYDMPKPVIAQVQGYCIGGGLHLALMCDLIIATDDALFGEPEVKYSYIPDILIEPWKLPFNKARELLYLGEFMDAKELHTLGVVNRIYPFEKLEEETMKVAKKLAAMPQGTMKMLKYQINKTYEIMGIKNSMDFAAEMFNLARIHQDQSEAEFNEKVRTEGLNSALKWKEEQEAKE